MGNIVHGKTLSPASLVPCFGFWGPEVPLRCHLGSKQDCNWFLKLGRARRKFWASLSGMAHNTSWNYPTGSQRSGCELQFFGLKVFHKNKKFDVQYVVFKTYYSSERCFQIHSYSRWHREHPWPCFSACLTIFPYTSDHVYSHAWLCFAIRVTMSPYTSFLHYQEKKVLVCTVEDTITHRWGSTLKGLPIIS